MCFEAFFLWWNEAKRAVVQVYAALDVEGAYDGDPREP